MVDEVRALSLQYGTILASFDPAIVRLTKGVAPDIPGAILFGETDADPVAWARAAGCEYVHPCWRDVGPRPDRLLTPEWVERVRDAGLGIICWHEHRPEVIRGLQAAGVDGICSDEPDLLVRYTYSAPHSATRDPAIIVNDDN
jgi:glycerophosphoryl diester phosphodiesterase